LLRYSSASFSTASGVGIANGATITVRVEASGSLASIYSDRDGSTPKSNPFTADSKGRFDFFVQPIDEGYEVSAVFGAETTTVNNVLDLIPFTPSGSGAVARTVSARLSDCVHIFDFIPTAMHNAIIAGTENDDLHSYFVNAFAQAVGYTLYVPKGTYYLATAGGVTQTGRVKMIGDGWQSTVIVRNFSPASDAIGAFNLGTNNASILADLQIKAATGTSGGCLLSIVSTAGAAASFHHLRNVELTFDSADTYKHAFYIDGSAKTGAPVGARDISFTNVLAFGGATGGGVGYIKGAVSFNWDGGAGFSGGSTSDTLTITGDATVNSTTVNIKVSALGDLALDYLTNFNITAGSVGDVTNTSNVITGVFSPGEASTYQHNWVDVVVLDATSGMGLSKKSLSTTSVSYLGRTIPTFSLPDTEAVTFTMETAGLFYIYDASGKAGLFFATNASATITIISDPSSFFENSATPTAGKIGVFKSAGSFVVSVINEVGDQRTISIQAVGKIASTTDPA
jgi:hypothetical protein